VHIHFRKDELVHAHTRAASLPSTAASTKHEQPANHSSTVEHPFKPLVSDINDHTNVLTQLTLPSLVARQAADTPDAQAVVEKGHALNYGQMNQQANRLAHYLQSLGVGPGMLVGLCLPRTIDMVIGLLAILKAGGAYVPLDPSYPPERLAFMLEDAQVAALMTQQRLASQFTLPTDKLVLLDSDALNRQLATLPTADPASTPALTDLAYVIYTSGSTGQPKGVQITHQNVLNLIAWHQRAFAITASDRATQIASPAFDATGWELWPYLTMGASVHIIDDDTRLAPIQLRDWLLANDITISFLPTPLAERVLALDWPETAALRFLLTGGDTLHRFPKTGMPFTLVNNYGPTEATVVATSGSVPPADEQRSAPSIGRPIENAYIYILDEQLQPVPAGLSGELYIGGAGIARGYLHRAELTAERFLPDPFNPGRNSRMYKTGDLARYLADGQIAFIGRADQQIKLRGYRIEPGEIENALTRHSAIQQAAVTTLDDDTDEKRLVAYLVPQQEQQVNATMLHTFLQASLPDYMIPAIFVLLPTLPLTANGKVDRAALPLPTTSNIVRDDELILPETPTEKRLAAIIAPLLGLEQVSIDDNFFMLGGHSLLGTQLIAKISGSFGVDLPLHSLFNAPTIRQLALVVTALLAEKIASMSEDEVLMLLQAEDGFQEE
jgi:amino acid adenylation domain-containing protein